MISKIDSKKEKLSEEFDFKKEVEYNSSLIDPDEFTKHRIQQMAMMIINTKDNNTFYELCDVMYRVHGVKYRIEEMLRVSNIQYLDDDDYFQIFATTLWQCLMDYNPDRNVLFDNFFIATFHYTFINTSKNSFLKVTGYVPEEKRGKIISYDSAFDELKRDKRKASQPVSVEDNMMRQYVRNLVKEILEKDEYTIIYTLFFESDLKVKDVECSKKLNVPIRRVRYLKKKAFEKIKNSNPNLYQDFFYNNIA